MLQFNSHPWSIGTNIILSPQNHSQQQRPIRVSRWANAAKNPRPAAKGVDAEETGVVIVGGGLAGLAAARHLALLNIPFLLLEASDQVGGRVKTDLYQGFLLDKGFQIFITAYPEAQNVLNYGNLNLQTFYSGALVYHNGGFHRVADPVRHFADSVGTLLNPIGSIRDKLLIGLTRIKLLGVKDEDLLSAEEVSILEKLQDDGFSVSIIDRFFRPFFGGIFFDTDLETSSRLFDFIFKCLAMGANTLPATGIHAIPQQIANKLPKNSVLLNSKVQDLVLGANKGPGQMARLENGRMVVGKFGLILAVEELEAERLLGQEFNLQDMVSKNPRSTVCLYFSSEIPPPIQEPILILNGSGKGIVNNMFFPTNVAPSYGPAGKTLVSVSLIGYYEDFSDEQLRVVVEEELKEWFGSAVVESWKLLRIYRICYAQPNQSPPTNLMKDPKFGFGVYLCGDHRISATFDGALVSGRRAAEALVKDGKLNGVL